MRRSTLSRRPLTEYVYRPDVLRAVEIVHASEERFVETLLSRIPENPPNHLEIVRLNERGEIPAGDPTELEAGANRCAIS
jgi:hypothetical protein